MRNHRYTDPEFMVSRYAGKCPETGKTWAKGETIAWFPASRTAYHKDSKAAEQIRGREFAAAYGMADAEY